MGRTTHLAQDQRRTLAWLSRLATLDGFYLAGGSAVAFHLGHRRSRDLDLFSAAPGLTLEAVSEELTTLGNVKVVAATDAMLKVRIRLTPRRWQAIKAHFLGEAPKVLVDAMSSGIPGRSRRRSPAPRREQRRIRHK